MQRSPLVLAWILATAVAMFLVNASVGTIADAVTDRPSAVRISPSGLPEPSGPEDPSPSSETQPSDLEEATSAVVPTTAPAPVPVQSTAPAPPHTHDSDPYDDIQRIQLDGGTVTLVCDGSDITIGSASPAPGWDIEIKESDGERVRIEFMRGKTELEVEAECKDGKLDYKVEVDD